MPFFEIQKICAESNFAGLYNSAFLHSCLELQLKASVCKTTIFNPRYTKNLLLIFQWLNISMTFCWNYVDIFIIVVSIGLATRFNQINDRLIANYRKVKIQFLIEINNNS